MGANISQRGPLAYEASGRPRTAPPARPGIVARVAARLGGQPLGGTREAVLAERLATLLGISQRLARTLDRSEILQTIVNEANRALAADGTTIRMLVGDRLEVAAWAGMDDEKAARLPAFARNEGWFAEICRTGRPLAAEDLGKGDVPGFERYIDDLAFSGVLVVPLVHHDQIIGALTCASTRPRRWSDDDLEFITALATDASIVITNAELIARSERRAAQFGVVQAASARMSRATSIQAVGRAIVEETRRILDYHNARVYVMEGSETLVPIAFEGMVGAYEKVDFDLLRTRLGVGFTGWVGQHGTALLIDDANADPRGATIPGTDEVDESMLVVPMRTDELMVGVITLSKLGLHQFTQDDLQLLKILADQAATALESARLLARSEDIALELRRIVEMSSALSASLDPRQVANLIAKHLVGALGVDECAISYWERPTGRVVTLGYYPQLATNELVPYFDIGGFPATTRVLEDQATVTVDVDDPAADAAEVELMRGDGFRSLVMLPLVAKGQSTGLVELLSRTSVTLDPSRLELARTMANEAAIALENARLYEDARNAADHDPLTGFYNHRYLHERLGEEVVRAQRSRQPLSMLMLDLDDFKLVNDTFGHLFGDRVLVATAERIRATLRASDVAARYGGDEFAIILPDTDSDSAERAAERILEAFRTQPFLSETRGPVPIAVSIGVASHPRDGRTGTELIAAADRGLYRVKRDGGHGVEPANPVVDTTGSLDAPTEAGTTAA